MTAALTLAATVDAVRVYVVDLDRYPDWLSIVATAEPDRSVDAVWLVELRAKVGPLSRSKRLRMTRTLDEPEHIRFERAEIDGRRHSEWTLDAHLRPVADGTELTMVLHYGGGFGGGIIERLLADEIESSKIRLRALLEVGSSRS